MSNDKKGLVEQLLAIPQDQFELILDLYRVYGTNYVAGILTAVAELRIDNPPANHHGVRMFHTNCAGCMAVAEILTKGKQ